MQMNVRKSCRIDAFLCVFDSWFCRNTLSTFCLHSSSLRPWSGLQCSSISLSSFTIYEGTSSGSTLNFISILQWDNYIVNFKICIRLKRCFKIKRKCYMRSVDSVLYFLIVFVATILLVDILHVISL